MKKIRTMKGLVCATLAATMVIGMSVPSLAAVIRRDISGGGEIVYTDNSNVNYPCWIWNRGYCYYYDANGVMAKGTVTPDGYTVDAEGRWTENGVPQHNGYGSVKMGTEEYNSKSSDEIWSLMVAKLKPVFESSAAVDEARVDASMRGFNSSYSNEAVMFDSGDAATLGADIAMVKNEVQSGAAIWVNLGNNWSDEVEITGAFASLRTAYAQKAAIKEKTIKAVIGDNVGQELFNYVAAHADKWSEGPGYQVALDSNGQPIKGNDEYVPDGKGDFVHVFKENPNGSSYKIVAVASYPDGMNAKALDFSAWQNRTTDYGKRFSVYYDKGLVIAVYN